MASGIYKIMCASTGKIYIGQSVRMKSRFSVHLADLKRGKHGNPYMKRAYEKYGKEAFSFSVIEYCEPEFLHEREFFWINHFDSGNPEKGFNILKDVNHGKSMISLWANPEFKKKMCIKHKARWEDPEFREKNLKGIREHHKEQKEKFGCLAFNTPEAKRKSSEKTHKNPEWLKKKSELAYKQLENPKYAKENLKRLAEGRKSPKRAENLKKHNERLALDEDFQKRNSERQKGLWSDPEHKAKRTELIKQKMSDPKVRKKLSDGLKKRYKEHPMSEETKKKIGLASKNRPKRSAETEMKRLASLKKTIEKRKLKV